MKCRKKITRNQRILSLGVGSLTSASISMHGQKTVRAMPITQNTSTIESRPANGSAAPPFCAKRTTDSYMAAPFQEKRSPLTALGGKKCAAMPRGRASTAWRVARVEESLLHAPSATPDQRAYQYDGAWGGCEPIA